MSRTGRTELPAYSCHKVVRALKIAEVNGNTLHPEDYRFADIAVSNEYLDKHEPLGPGYYVVYEDGYKSWSPVKVFEEGYRLIKS